VTRWEAITVDPVWQAVIWATIPAALLILAVVLGALYVRHRQPRRQEDPVEQAYLAAKAQAAHGASRHLPAPSR
jgi:hypothetical protein